MAYLSLADLQIQIATLIADNNAGDITAADVRSVLRDMSDSLADARNLSDNTIDAVKAKADTAALRKAWREALGSAHIGAGITLPAAAESNEGDVRIFLRDVNAGLDWRDIRDRDAALDSAVSGDIGLFIGAGWIRVGNLLQNPSSDAAEALASARDNSARLNVVEPLVTDIDKIVDGTTWANAPADEAQFALFPSGSTIGQKLARINQAPIDPAADIPNATVWRTALNNVPADQWILIRIKPELRPLQYRTNRNGYETTVYSSDLLVNDDTWNYYQGGNVGGGAMAIEKRTDTFHTAWHGELSGRALAQVEDISLHDRQQYFGVAHPYPSFLTLDSEATTLTVNLDVDRINDMFGSDEWARISIGGHEGGLQRIRDFPPTLALNDADVGNLVRNSAATGYVLGQVHIGHVEGVNFVADDTLIFLLEIREKSGEFRTLAGASPYAIRTSDDKFEFALEQTQMNQPSPLLHTKEISRRVLTEAVQHLVVAENRPEDNNVAALLLDLNLNATGTELTVALARRGGTGFTDADFARWSLKSVGAK